MTDETDNTLEGVTDNVENLETDTADDYDYFDPDEDEPDTEEVAESEAPDDEDEGETEAEAEAETEEEPVAYADEKAVVKLPDGSEIPVAELIKGRMLQSDYTRKTQEVANERKAVQADVERMQRITDAFVDHLSALVPDPPSPSLALTDPNRYTAQKAQHEAAMAQVQQLIEMGQAPKEIMDRASQADTQRELQEANQRLVEMFPEAANDRVHDVSYESALRAAGFEVQVIANQGTGAAMKRVEALRRLFPSCWFDADRCEAGLDALGWYHEKRDDERNIGLGPNHDWSSHCADAAGLVAVAYEMPQGKSSDPVFKRRKIA